jgi:hypothetical protein
MRPSTLELRSAFLTLHASQIFYFYRRPGHGRCLKFKLPGTCWGHRIRLRVRRCWRRTGTWPPPPCGWGDGSNAMAAAAGAQERRRRRPPRRRPPRLQRPPLLAAADADADTCLSKFPAAALLHAVPAGRCSLPAEALLAPQEFLWPKPGSAANGAEGAGAGVDIANGSAGGCAVGWSWRAPNGAAPSGHWTVRAATPAAGGACCSFGTVPCGTVEMSDCPGAEGAEQRHCCCLWTPCPASLHQPALRQRIGCWRAARRVKRQTTGNAMLRPLQRYASDGGIRSALIIMPSRRWTKQQDLASLGAPRSSLVCASRS